MLSASVACPTVQNLKEQKGLGLDDEVDDVRVMVPCEAACYVGCRRYTLPFTDLTSCSPRTPCLPAESLENRYVSGMIFLNLSGFDGTSDARSCCILVCVAKFVTIENKMVARV